MNDDPNNVILAHFDRAIERANTPVNPLLTVEALLGWLRSRCWAVAVHNDYKQGGANHTFWLFTHPCGLYAKGEGNSDRAALRQVVTRVMDLEPRMGQPCSTIY